VRRSLLALLAGLVLLVAAACARSAESDFAGGDDDVAADEGDPGDDDPSAPPPSGAVCSEAVGCVPAVSTCCACPTFAVPAGSGREDACADVPCPAPPSCPAVRAVCDDGACALVCAEITCDRVCATGFAVDLAGCLTCACAAPPTPACTTAADCMQVPADCCGCARGGADTAVLADGVDEHVAGLACTGGEVCPEVDVCAPSAVICRNGACALLPAEDGPPGALPADACGRSDLPPCPAGQRCVLNRSPDADSAAVGVCAPA
jgi:hypothetical protein